MFGPVGSILVMFCLWIVLGELFSFVISSVRKVFRILR